MTPREVDTTCLDRAMDQRAQALGLVKMLWPQLGYLHAVQVAAWIVTGRWSE